MKVTAFNGSPRKGGNTEMMLKTVLSVLEKEGIDTELLQIGGRKIQGCTACMKCKENKDKRCVIADDIVNDCIQKAMNSDGMLIGSPTYFSDLTAETKALIDRMGYVSGANGGLFAKKVGAAVSAVRRGGGVCTFDSINHFFQISQMFIVGSTYWNIGIGREKEEVANDEEGMKNMQNLGENMAWLLKKIK